jgi:threonylcarbamoyladenosine tRNA methylthiotransferase CDKAL1
MDIEDFDGSAVERDDATEHVAIGKRRRGVLPRGEEEGSAVIPGAGRTVYVKSYGCGHNTSDGEVMAGLLQRAGYNVTSSLATERIDAFLINSCTVKSPSESSFRALVAECKQRGGQVVVTGCVPQADAKKAETQWGDVSVIGVQQIERVVEVVDEALRGNRVHLLGRSKKSKPSLNLPKIRRNQFIEIIPINLGCLGACTYCKTVHARGSLTSYTREQVVDRVRQSVAEGVKEIRLTSEDAGAYGRDIGTNIAALLRDVLEAVPDGVMVKLGMVCHSVLRLSLL